MKILAICLFAVAVAADPNWRIEPQSSGDDKDDDKCKQLKALDCAQVMAPWNHVRKLCDVQGNTYANRCEFFKAHCDNPDLKLTRCDRPDKMKPDVETLAGSGEPEKPDDKCEEVKDMDCSVIARWNHKGTYCDSKGNKYSNRCEFEKARCADPELTPKKCRMVTRDRPSSRVDEECKQAETVDCSLLKEHVVCDDKGNEYPNRCYLFQAYCKDRTLQRAHCPLPTNEPGSGDQFGGKPEKAQGKPDHAGRPDHAQAVYFGSR
ncbi:SPARC-related modular calcium-binding protein 2-like [Lingula anatina]|uniref:SPARC-related modular calcium-binding protein 2-like n=1 Tax=Lingula anatina TaxID=7574 RepID=A0A1S3I2H7_LINAN|nr:SPARC-related modular calcium-binding protein 2-like [Lingula anatina]|eukprot:XP_013392448.1 SPARC-related modular calcium-binding protein 2-like [Lingula anatina]